MQDSVSTMRIYHSAKSWRNYAMDVKEIRWRKLVALIDKHGYAYLVGKGIASESYLSQIKNKVLTPKGRIPRGVGDKLARTIEKCLGLPNGWMDQIEPSDSAQLTSIPASPNYSKQIQGLLTAVLNAEKIGIPPEEITVATKNFERYVSVRRLEPSLDSDLSIQGGARVKAIQQQTKRDPAEREGAASPIDQETTKPTRHK